MEHRNMFFFHFSIFSDIIFNIREDNMKKEVQEIYINLDDSGKLTSKEHVSVYGGLVFSRRKRRINLLLNIEV